MGGTGDLMERKLLPALFHLSNEGLLGKECQILGVSRSKTMNDESFRAWALDALDKAEGVERTGRGTWCSGCLHFQSIGSGTPADFEALAQRIRDLEAMYGLPGNRTFYLALPPRAFVPTVSGLGAAGLDSSRGWTRLVVEKPVGRDLESARVLNAAIHQHFDESQVYRIDHYLGKETVQNLLVIRFANPIFESLWNRDRISSVQITVAEELGVGDRAGYYDNSGAVRDMIQNHLTQLLALVAMEVPVRFEADAIRDEKVKVLRAVAPIGETDVVLGQYGGGEIDGRRVPGYLQEEGVAPQSRTETYAAIKLHVDNWRWQGVPFLLRTGKRLPKRTTHIMVRFRRAPVSLFEPYEACRLHNNEFMVWLQPDEGFDLRFEIKRPGEPFALTTHTLDFRYGEAYARLSDAYETLLLDVLIGDQTLFVRADEVEAAWGLYTPVLEREHEVHLYPAGSWGPDQADSLVTDGQWAAV
jgi:glucose-6-phosphate 1-dehydrogenase